MYSAPRATGRSRIIVVNSEGDTAPSCRQKCFPSVLQALVITRRGAASMLMIISSTGSAKGQFLATLLGTPGQPQSIDVEGEAATLTGG